MSVRAVSIVLDAKIPDVPARPELDPIARRGSSGGKLKLILIALADRADEHGRNAWPGIRELAQRSQSSLDTVQIGLAQLRIEGLIWRVSEGDRSRADSYDLDLEALQQLSTSVRLSRTPGGVLSRAPRAAQSRTPARGSGAAHNVHTSVHPATADAVATISSVCIDCNRPAQRGRFRCDECAEQRQAS